jgi:hypothetical protein
LLRTGHAISVKKLDTAFSDYRAIQHYTIFWIKEGVDLIQIDGNVHLCNPDTLWLMAPGQHLVMRYSSRLKGWVLKMEKSFFEKQVCAGNITQNRDHYLPVSMYSRARSERLQNLIEMIDELNGSADPNQEKACIQLLITLLLYSEKMKPLY